MCQLEELLKHVLQKYQISRDNNETHPRLRGRHRL